MVVGKESERELLENIFIKLGDLNDLGHIVDLLDQVLKEQKRQNKILKDILGTFKKRRG